MIKNILLIMFMFIFMDIMTAQITIIESSTRCRGDNENVWVETKIYPADYNPAYYNLFFWEVDYGIDSLTIPNQVWKQGQSAIVSDHYCIGKIQHTGDTIKIRYKIPYRGNGHWGQWAITAELGQGHDPFPADYETRMSVSNVFRIKQKKLFSPSSAFGYIDIKKEYAKRNKKCCHD